MFLPHTNTHIYAQKHIYIKIKGHKASLKGVGYVYYMDSWVFDDGIIGEVSWVFAYV